MNHLFKPGDLALIVSCPPCPQIVGTCVELIERVAPHTHVHAYECNWTNWTSYPGWIVQGEGLYACLKGHGLVPHTHALIREPLLMPLVGKGIDFSVEQHKDVHQNLMTRLAQPVRHLRGAR
ncbi:hypothetical protein [Pseudomonas protegens]|uniref:hypothetical protein n=1 Tax=Pseudomonas protegens TaxID=380021 RepID=UPI0011B2021C|nr:hypothetical protein [Pseudomonas protegens]